MNDSGAGCRHDGDMTRKPAPTTVEVDPDLTVTVRSGAVALAAVLTRADAVRLAAALCEFASRTRGAPVQSRVELSAHR